jgi:type 1 glutamine amidotransferase
MVLCDDLWHPGEVIMRGFCGLGRDEFTFDFIMDAKDILSPELLAGYPAVICCKGDYINAANKAPWFEDGVTEVGVREFEDYVAGGGGFLSIHSANTAAEGSPYAAFAGNSFIGHPPRCKVDVEIIGNHPVVQGVSNFTIRDEHYQIAVNTDEIIELFHTVSETGGDQIGGYARQIGKGRLCVMTPGHLLSVWEHGEYRKLLLNALRWCLKH